MVTRDNSLFFKLSKCVFHAPSIDYLGVILERGVTRMDPVKVAGVRNWPTPKNTREVCSFHSFCNFYHPFIKAFSQIALLSRTLRFAFIFEVVIIRYVKWHVIVG